MQNKKYFQYGVIFLVLIIVDQVLKFILNRYFPSIIFSSQNFLGMSSYLQLALLVILIAIIILLYYKNKNFQQNLLAFVFIISGALSNLLDRFFHGHVIDYLPIINGYFNLSDLYILFGLILIVLNIRKRANSC